MICYRDMTFCPFVEGCENAQHCPRALTPEVLAAADEWWAPCEGGAPIATFVYMPVCHTLYVQDRNPVNAPLGGGFGGYDAED